MRRKISLYIGGRKADINEQGFILFNYLYEDITEPAAIKNSFTHEITLPGTANNDAIFGDFFRLDRVIGNNGGVVGSDYNPSQKTPFAIYNEMNEILESGYVKLNSIRKGKVNEYNITLFGGLGSFMSALSFDSEGNKRTLADIDYLGTIDPERELDFIINADAVSAAWETDPMSGDIDSIWKVLNFAPAYNGIPEGNFSADKALVTPSLVGLPDSVGVYSTKEGYALVNLAQSHDEWAMKDLRSYMQRPVLSMRAFFNAICKPKNNGGYDVEMPFFDKYAFAPYKNLFLTLPMIPSIKVNKADSTGLSSTLSPGATYERNVATLTINGTIPSGSKVDANFGVKFQMYMPGTSASSLSRSARMNTYTDWLGKESIFFIQAIGLRADDTIVAGSKVKCVYSRNITPSEMASVVGYSAPYDMGDDTFDTDIITTDVFNNVGSGFFELSKELGFSISGYNIQRVIVNITSYTIQTTGKQGNVGRIFQTSGGSQSMNKLYVDYDTEISPVYSCCVQGSIIPVVSIETNPTLRSGATITKSMLMSSSKTPSEYLASFCKMFGLHILVNEAEKKVSILDRDDFFQNEVIDLSKRVDKSHGIDVTPFVFDSKWYDFKLESVGGAYAEEYESRFGIGYGLQRVNTNYGFDAEPKDVLSGNAFKSATTILDRTRYYNTIKVASNFRPSVFADQGNTFTLWNPAGASQDTTVPTITDNAVITYFNDNYPGYDKTWCEKNEFRSKDNKPIDGTDVLLFYDAVERYPYFQLTDDVPAMDTINGGKPCWLINPGTSQGLRVPIFRGYTGDEGFGEHSLDFGMPKEFNKPDLRYSENATLYRKFWKNYISDRYDVNSKVMHCRVNLQGLKADADLLRKFYWYGGALWSLNKITNYSITTFDTAECEFVQVQDPDNYNNNF